MMPPTDPKYWQNRHRRKRLEQPELYMWRSAKYRAKARGTPFNIGVEDVVIPTHCPVLGIELTPNMGRLTDSSPTLDRIKSTLGYIKGNVEVISWRANRLKGDATPEDLRKLANYYEQKGRESTSAANKKKASR